MALVDTIRFRLPLKIRIKPLLPAIGEHFLIESYTLGYEMLLTFQRAILNIFSYLINGELEVYMDDFTPYRDGFEPALQTLEKVLQRCISTTLYLSHEKCHMMMTDRLI